MAIGFKPKRIEDSDDDVLLDTGMVEISDTVLRIFTCVPEDIEEAFNQVLAAIALNMFARLETTTDDKGLDIIRVTIYEDDPCSQ